MYQNGKRSGFENDHWNSVPSAKSSTSKAVLIERMSAEGVMLFYLGCQCVRSGKLQRLEVWGETVNMCVIMSVEGNIRAG